MSLCNTVENGRGDPGRLKKPRLSREDHNGYLKIAPPTVHPSNPHTKSIFCFILKLPLKRNGTMQILTHLRDSYVLRIVITHLPTHGIRGNENLC